MNQIYAIDHNRAAISGTDLQYALDLDNLLCLNDLTPEDASQIRVFDAFTASVIDLAETEDIWAAIPVTEMFRSHKSVAAHFCTYLGEKLHVLVGGKAEGYLPLKDYLKTATSDIRCMIAYSAIRQAAASAYVLEAENLHPERNAVCFVRDNVVHITLDGVCVPFLDFAAIGDEDAQDAFIFAACRQAADNERMLSRHYEVSAR